MLYLDSLEWDCVCLEVLEDLGLIDLEDLEDFYEGVDLSFFLSWKPKGVVL